MTTLAFAAVAIMAQSPTAPSAQETWAWDDKSPICVIKQQAPTGSTSLTIERTPGGEKTDLLIVLPSDVKIRNGTYSDATVRLDSDSNFVATVLVHVNRDRRSELWLSTIDPAFAGHLWTANAIELNHARIGTVRVPVHVPAKVAASLGECEDTTMRSWGIDPVAWRGLRSRPVPIEDPLTRFSADDYPKDALAANIEADAVTKLEIGPEGRVVGCATVNAGLPRSFAVASCHVLQGAKFNPALDSSGKPVSAPIVFDVKFRIGD